MADMDDMDVVHLLELNPGDKFKLGVRDRWIVDANNRDASSLREAIVVGKFVDDNKETVLIDILGWPHGNIPAHRLEDAINPCDKMIMADGINMRDARYYVYVGKSLVVIPTKIAAQKTTQPNSFPIPFIRMEEVIVGDTIAWAGGAGRMFYMTVNDLEESERDEKRAVCLFGTVYTSTGKAKNYPRGSIFAIDRGVLLIKREPQDA